MRAGTIAAGLFVAALPAGAADLVAYFPFEEGRGAETADATGRHPPARLLGEAAFAEGKYGLGVELGGPGDWIDAGPALLDTTRSHSAACWIRLAEGFESDFRTAVSQDGPGRSAFFLQYCRPGGGSAPDSLCLAEWSAPDGGSTVAAGSRARPPAGRWIHLAGVHDLEAKELRLYVDGALAGRVACDAAGGAFAWPAAGSTAIGRGLFGGRPVDPFLGRIDEVYLFRGALDEAEVRKVREDRWLPVPPRRGEPTAVAESREVTVDAGSPGPAISPLLFGHNLEHTRRALSGGLSAQLLANRKFAGEAVADGPDGARVPRGAPGPDGVAARWYGIGGTEARFALSAPDAFAGKTSQRIETAGAGPAGVGQAGVPVEGGRDIEARVWLRPDRSRRVTASFVDRRGSVLARASAAVEAGGWRPWEFVLRPARTEPAARFEVSFDGPGALAIGAASLLPAGHFQGLRADAIALLAKISVPILRWPGGNFTRDYRWQDGLLPVDRRPPVDATWCETLALTDNHDPHDVGTDEYIALCRRLRAEPCITVGLRDDIASAADAAAWVEYANGRPDTRWGKVRAERGHREPYRVRYWSIGNEVYGPWMGPARREAAAYARDLAAYAAAMRAVDPSIVLIASGSPGDWDRTLLAGAAGSFDLLSEHHYAAEGGAHGLRPDPGEYRRLLRIPGGEVAGMLGGVREAIGASAPGRKIGIAFDEWNVWHDWFIRPPEHEWHVGPIDGAYAACMLGMLCRSADRLGISVAALFQPVREGAIAVEPSGARLTTVGQVFVLFHAHHGGRLLPVKAPRGIDACASLAASGGRVAITLAARRGEGDRTVDLVLEGGRQVDGAVAATLRARDLAPDVPFEESSAPLAVLGGGRIPVELPRYGVVLVDVGLR